MSKPCTLLHWTAEGRRSPPDMDRKALGSSVALPLTPNPSPALGRGEAICLLNFNSFTALVGKVGLEVRYVTILLYVN